MEISFFSPLGDESPRQDADAIYLPGGYPELHAGRLAQAGRFQAGIREAAARGLTVYGECGGYMVLGESLQDAEGVAHPMLGLCRLRRALRKENCISATVCWNRLKVPLDGAIEGA